KAAIRAGGHPGSVTHSPAKAYEVSLLGHAPLPMTDITESLLIVDSAAPVAVNGCRALLRFSPFLCPDDASPSPAQARFSVTGPDLRQLPSVCCGGCGG